MEVLRQASGKVVSLRRSGKMLTCFSAIRIMVSYFLSALYSQHMQSENYEIIFSLKLSLPLQSYTVLPSQ